MDSGARWAALARNHFPGRLLAANEREEGPRFRARKIAGRVAGKKRALGLNFHYHEPVKLFPVVLLSLLVLACNKSAAHLHEAPPPILEPSWSTLQSGDSTVSIGVPQSFHNALDRPPALLPAMSTDQPPQAPPPQEEGGDPSKAGASPSDANSQDADQATKRIIGDMNNLSSQMEEAQRDAIVKRMQKDGILIWAWLNGNQTIGEGITQIAVKKFPNVGSISLDDAMNSAKQGMLGGATVEKVTLPIGDAELAKADYQNRIGDEQTEIIYVLLDGGDEYQVRFYATNGKDQIEPIADPVMQTLRIKPKA